MIHKGLPLACPTQLAAERRNAMLLCPEFLCVLCVLCGEELTNLSTGNGMAGHRLTLQEAQPLVVIPARDAAAKSAKSGPWQKATYPATIKRG